MSVICCNRDCGSLLPPWWQRSPFCCDCVFIGMDKLQLESVFGEHVFLDKLLGMFDAWRSCKLSPIGISLYATSKNMRKRIVDAQSLRRHAIRCHAKRQFPHFEEEFAQWGEPDLYFPVPLWRFWRCDVYWYCTAETGRLVEVPVVDMWHLRESHWARKMPDDFLQVWQDMWHTAGVYKHQSMYWSYWEYNSLERVWALCDMI